MKEFEQIQIESRQDLRKWLADNHQRTEGIWLVSYKKNVPEKYVPWDEIVEEALCFGWIDSTARKLDGERSMLLLSPRRPGSPWSGLNKRRVEKLAAAELIMSPGWSAIERAKEDGSWTVLDDVEALIIPEDLAVALAENKTAAANFKSFSDSSIKGILWWIKSAKQEATRKKRIAETVQLAEHKIKANFPEAREFKRRQQREGGSVEGRKFEE
jgi:uncharacterized protein YdeI (YjbR/CyaY-like superfamily)